MEGFADRETRVRESGADYLIGSIVDGHLPTENIYRMDGNASSSSGSGCGGQGTHGGGGGGGGDSCSGQGTNQPPHGED